MLALASSSGCVNHALLTANQCQQAGISARGRGAGRALGTDRGSAIATTSSATLQGKVKILGILPFDEDEAASVKAGAQIFDTILLPTHEDAPLHPTIAERARRVCSSQRTSRRSRVARSARAACPMSDVPDLLTLADDVRARNCGNGIAVEVLYNAKKGGCSEDCHFCSQSARFASDVEPETLSSVEGFVAAARDAHARGAGEFCIVVAVRGPSTQAARARVRSGARDQEPSCRSRSRSRSAFCAKTKCAQLVEAGVDKVNHNLETSRRYFPSVCTTHTFDERMETLQLVRSARVSRSAAAASSAWARRSTIASTFSARLQELEPEEVPINFLNPRPGTPFQDRSLVEPVEALRFVAMARLALPAALVRFAGGREITLQGLQDLGMRSGASGIVLGNYLTTGGRSDQDDFAMLDRLGFEVLA